MSKERFYTVYVKVGLAVSLAYDGKRPSKRQLKRDAIENFLDHPALKSRGECEPFVDSIVIEEEK